MESAAIAVTVPRAVFAAPWAKVVAAHARTHATSNGLRNRFIVAPATTAGGLLLHHCFVRDAHFGGVHFAAHVVIAHLHAIAVPHRSEEHTSELQSRFGISYAVFCL